MTEAFILGDFSRSEAVAKARALVPVLKERADRQWNQPRVLQETIDDLYEAGLLQVFQPKRWGGSELHPSEIFEVIMTLAEGDASVAWVTGVLGVHSFHLALLSDQAQRDVWGEDPRALIGSPYAPSGTATKVDGGYRLSGRWRFSSGCHHCTWTFLGALVGDDPVTGSFTGPHASALLPRSDYEIVENWEVHGLRATGSHDIVVKDAFVPDHRMVKFSDIVNGSAPGHELNKGELYRFPFSQVFSRATSTPVAVGALKGMVDDFIDAAKDRTTTTGSRPSEDGGVSLALAKACVTVDDLKSWIHRSFAQLETWISDGSINERMDERRKLRFQTAFGPSRCADAASELYRVYGGSGIYRNVPFGRQLNDIFALRSHFTNNYQPNANGWIGALMGAEVKHMAV